MLLATRVTADLTTPLQAGENVIYCAAFQLAWTQLCHEVVQAPVQLQGHPHLAEILNQHFVTAADVPPDSYIALAGFGRDNIVARWQAAWQEKFTTPPPPLELAPHEVLASAYLARQIQFNPYFEACTNPLIFQGGQPVAAFGIEKNYAAAKQVVILDYRQPNDFILRLQADPELLDMMAWGYALEVPPVTDQIILAQVPPLATLQATLEHVLARTRLAWPHNLQQAVQANEDLAQAQWRLEPHLNAAQGDILRIPKINIDTVHHFSELIGRYFLNQGLEDYLISQAYQSIQFRLDERGAEIRSQATLQASLGMVPPPRHFIFDRPFLLALKKPESHSPYFIVWVDNAELLERVT